MTNKVYIVEDRVTEPEMYGGKASLGDKEWQFSDGVPGERENVKLYLSIEEGMRDHPNSVFIFMPLPDKPLYDWNDKHEPYQYQIPAEKLNAIFNKLWWKVGRYFDSSAYVSDLLWDAELLYRRGIDAQTLFVIRPMGTLKFDSLEDAKNHVDLSDGVAVLRVVKRKYSYDMTIVYEKQK